MLTRAQFMHASAAARVGVIDDAGVARVVEQLASLLRRHNPRLGEHSRLIACLGLAWAECGFPAVEPGHRLTASLMSTSFGGIETPGVIWPCFAVIVPSGFLSEPSWVLIGTHEGTYRQVIFFGALVGVSYLDSFDGFLHERVTHGQEIAERAKRLETALGRLVVGCWLEMLERRPSDLQAPLERAQLSKREGKAPSLYSYKLTRPVHVDVRQAVRDFVEGNAKSSPTVQTLVRGHWKQQPYGPGREQRKYIHVEPYWRGPEDAPIAVRTHKIGLDQ